MVFSSVYNGIYKAFMCIIIFDSYYRQMQIFHYKHFITRLLIRKQIEIERERERERETERQRERQREMSHVC